MIGIRNPRSFSGAEKHGRAASRSGVHRRRVWIRSAVCAVVAGVTILVNARPAAAIRVMAYNIANYSSGRVTELQTIFNAIQPDVLVVEEMQGNTGVSNLLNAVLNGAGGPGGYSAATFVDGPDTDAALLYRGSRITFTPGGVNFVDLTTTPRHTPRWRVGLVGYTSLGSQIYLYGMHIKAGSAESDQAERLAAAQLIRANANALPAGSNLIYAGDFNIQSSTEASYGELTGSQADNDGRAFDPINMPGTWNNNSAFAAIHTQSPHLDNPGGPPGVIGGGMDDRFDFLLISATMNDSQGLAYLLGTYKPYGNDGLHFNMDINDPPTIPEGIGMANALHAASDHIPVIMDLKVPAVISTNASIAFGTFVVGRAATADLTVTNVGNAALFGLVDGLDYNLVAPVGFTVPGGPFVEPVGPGSNVHTVTMLTSTPGLKSGNLVISTDDPEHLTVLVPLSGTVLARGDLTQDLSVDIDDVQPFVDLLLDPDAATPLQIQLADMNVDGNIDGLDVSPFADALLNP